MLNHDVVTARHPGIEIVDVKDRMNTPTSGGWGDVLILFRVVGSTGHICEMQIALHMLLTARKEMGAHAAYAQARHFIEIFEASSGQQFHPPEFFTPTARSASGASGDTRVSRGGVAIEVAKETAAATAAATLAAVTHENAALAARNQALTAQLHIASATALVGWVGLLSAVAYATFTGRGRAT